MKIYNFGSDYARQSQLKHKVNQPTVETEQLKETVKNNAGNQIQRGGEGEMATDPKLPETSKKIKKKKENGAEKE